MASIKKFRFLIIGTLVLIIYFTIVYFAFSAEKPTEVQWTLQTLKEYMDQRLTSMQLAVSKAEEATEKRFEGVNEFRNTLSDQQRTFVPRSEYEAGHIELHVQVSELKTRLDKIESMKQGGNVVWAYVLAGVSLIIAIFSIKDRIIKK